eukprot:TRINITY_DN3283_c0_g1_i11.p1 TRINITY_DN3283_c0_g1~~TRINITY_DN3283_c0_g1_i11.p1  ORF type:complete len:1009 (-),score=195.52 TRINITY_DN3283_c0_g1_i11:109-3135(-)
MSVTISTICKVAVRPESSFGVTDYPRDLRHVDVSPLLYMRLFPISSDSKAGKTFLRLLDANDTSHSRKDQTSWSRFLFQANMSAEKTQISGDNYGANYIVVTDKQAAEFKWSDGQELSLSTCKGIALSRVVILTSTQHDYQHAQDESFKKQLYAKASIIYKNQALNSYHDFQIALTVAHCEPVMQGFISPDSTHIVVIAPDASKAYATPSKGDSHVKKDSSSKKAIADLFPKDQYTKACLTKSITFVSPFLHILAQSISNISHQGPSYPNPPYPQAGPNPSSSTFPVRLNQSLQITVSRSAHQMDIYRNQDPTRDNLSEIGVSFDTLRELSLSDGSWVELSSKSILRAAKIRYSPSVSGNETALLSPTLMFALQLRDGDRIRVSWLQDGSAPEFATEALISRVASTVAIPSHLIDRSLKKFFSTPRCFSIGDIIPVPILRNSLETHNNDVDPEETVEEDDQVLEANLPSSANHSTSISHFKLTSATPVGLPYYIISTASCNLSIKDITNSLVPVGMDSYLFNNKEDDCPPALRQPFSKLCSIISPVLDPSSKRLGLTGAIILHGPKGSGKHLLSQAVAKSLGLNFLEADCYDLVSVNEAKTEANLVKLFTRAKESNPSVLLLRRIHALGKSTNESLQDRGNEPRISAHLLKLMGDASNGANPVIVIATSRSLMDVAVSVRACFRHEIPIETPDEKGRTEILKTLCKNIPLSSEVSIEDLSRKTAGMVGQDLQTLIAHASGLMIRRIPKIAKEMNLDDNDITAAGMEISLADIESSVSFMQSHQSAKIGAPKIPNVTWDDVGGLVSVKKEILDTIQLPLSHPELFGSGLKQRSGVLLFGPPGTGKTLLAKAVATECSLNFLSVKGPELINMYVGESEKNVREVFQKAYDARPCVIFFDELDSLAPNRGKGADSGGVMDRIVSQLLAELDGLQSSNSVFVIGATNRPDLIDPALLRPGRFDRLLYLGISSDRESQFRIVEALTRKYVSQQHALLSLSIAHHRNGFSSWKC